MATANKQQMESGQRVEVNWGQRGWLPGTFVEYTNWQDRDGNRTCVVDMDNRLPCGGAGYSSACVREVSHG